MEPEEFNAHRLAHSVGGVVVAPERGTCSSSSPPRVLDFFVVSRMLSGRVRSVATELGAHTRPHSP
eukprot:5190680-Alexandrium_andersonii.AAC.1